MAKPPHLFRADGYLDELVVHIRRWSVGLVDKIGSDPRSSYVENFSLGKLWHRTSTFIVHQLAGQLGLSEGEFRQQCRISSRKVAEFQARGLAHFHVIVRLDGPGGAATAPPEGLTVEVLSEAVRRAGPAPLSLYPTVELPGEPARSVGATSSTDNPSPTRKN